MKKIIFFIIVLTISGIKTYSQSITWQRLYNGLYPTSSDNGRGICETQSGDLYVTGFGITDGGIVFKLKPNGDTIWKNYFPGFTGEFILPTLDEGCIVAGENASVMKLDLFGQIIWQSAGVQSSNATDITKCSDGGYVVCGYVSGILPAPAFALKIDSIGNLRWRKFFYAGHIKAFYSITELENNDGYLLTGYKYECELCNGYPLILELNNSGDSLWEKKYNLFADFKRVFTIQNGYLIGGTILDSPYIYINAFIMKTNLNGDITFRNNIEYNNREDLKDMVIINENKYAIACDTDTLNRRSGGVYIVDSSGTVLNRNIFYVTDYSLFFSVSSLLKRDLIFAGTVETHMSQRRDIYIVRTDSNLFANPVGISDENNEIVTDFLISQNYPNPFNPITKIRYKLPAQNRFSFEIRFYDVLGKVLKSQNIGKNSVGAVFFDGTNFPSGIYFYSLFRDNEIIQTKKMLLIK